MADVLWGLMLVAFFVSVVYAIDAASTRASHHRTAASRLGWAAAIAMLAGAALWLVLSYVSDGSIPVGAAGGIVAALALALVLAPAGRGLIARLLPISRGSPRDLVGLVILLWLVIFRLAEYYSADDDFDEVTVQAAAIQALALLGIAVAAVGFVTRRSLGETLSRLGLAQVRMRAVVVGIAAVVPIAIVGALTVVIVDWAAPGTSERLEETVTQITGGQTGLGYALALGLLAAVGEEILFRGALQPKYGLLFTSLVFALLHVQYDLLLVVASLFPVGLILGLERRYLGTITCIITHALYNAIAVMVS